MASEHDDDRPRIEPVSDVSLDKLFEEASRLTPHCVQSLNMYRNSIIAHVRCPIYPNRQALASNADFYAIEWGKSKAGQETQQ